MGTIEERAPSFLRFNKRMLCQLAYCDLGDLRDLVSWFIAGMRGI